MTQMKTINIGSSAAAWGDTIEGVGQLLKTGKLDYLVGDYLAEVTMAILAKIQAKDPEAGYVPDWIASIKPHLAEIKKQGIKLVTNSGGMKPLACRDALLAAAQEAGIAFKIAVITGDDLMTQEEYIRAAGLREMFNGNALPAKMISMNAYLGAAPIAEALSMGADVVITGRSVDTAMVLGPLMHEFNWGLNDFDKLAAGSLAGHIIECGTQATGGLYTDWEEVADGWDNMGFPIVECHENGDFVVFKPDNTGGKVSFGTVAEQMVYEIGDPQDYRLPDVTCDFSQTQLNEVETDRVLVTNVKGRAPSNFYKVCGTCADGFRLLTTYMVAGWEADKKARKAAEALIKRSQRLMAERGFADYGETSIEVIGAEDTYGANRQITHAREVIVKIGLRHHDPKALNVFAKEFAVPAVAMAQGISGIFGGRPVPGPVVKIHSFLIEKSNVDVCILFGDKVTKFNPAAGLDHDPIIHHDSIPLADTPSQAVLVPLRALVWGRSGDKGNHANIGLISRKPEFAPFVKAQITSEKVAQFFAHYLNGQVTRYEMPGINGFNFMLEDVLDGGGTGSLRYDPQAKTFAQMFLDVPVSVPSEWLVSNGPLTSFSPNL